MLTSQDVIDWIRTSPDGKRIASQKEQADRGARRTAYDAVLAAERERDEKLPALDKARARAEEQYKAALATAKQKEEAFRVADVNRRRLLQRAEHAIGQAQAALRASAPAAIDETIVRLDELHAALLKGGVRYEQERIGWSGTGTPVMRSTRTNRDTLTRRLEAIIDARLALDHLKERFTEDLDADLAAILATIPGGLDGETPFETITHGATVAA